MQHTLLVSLLLTSAILPCNCQGAIHFPNHPMPGPPTMPLPDLGISFPAITTDKAELLRIANYLTLSNLKPDSPLERFLNKLILKYEEMDGREYDGNLAIELEHHLPLTVTDIDAECGSKNILRARPEPYNLELKTLASPCSYSITTANAGLTSVVCSGLNTSTRELSCHHNVIHVIHGDTNTTLSCGKEKTLTLPHDGDRTQHLLRSELQFITSSFIVEDDQSTAYDAASTDAVEAALAHDQICPNSCGTSPAAAAAMEALMRIVGGYDARPGQFPWQVLIVSKGASSKLGLCGGSLLNSRFAMSAAHCFKREIWMSVKAVQMVAGMHSIAKEVDSFRQIISVKRIVVHPAYDYLNFVRNDIALIELSREVDFTERVGPVCLAAPGAKFGNQPAIVTGFGITSVDLVTASYSHIAEVMQVAHVTLVEDWMCDAPYTTYGIPINLDRQICSKGLLQEACKGDSGGPVVVKDEDTGRYTQVGIVSFGIGCTDLLAPSVNTRVSAYRTWIESVVITGSCPH
uniref:Chymotrypsin-like elastase family member 2A n=1 Tax=Hirondellea gigas TaxID=1518452 RepID=A0A6A7G694_9CRUS